MESLLVSILFLSLFIWSAILLLPWKPWLVSETLEGLITISNISQESEKLKIDLSQVSVVIPARNEAAVIAGSLNALQGQGQDFQVILVDDCSSDSTVEIARKNDRLNLTLVEGKPLARGWTGKLWALQQGVTQVRTKYILFLDADIQLAPGVLADLIQAAVSLERPFISIMAALPMKNFWEKLLTPAFIFFFKLLYPFRLANSADRRFAAAAGGCILMETKLLESIGGLESIHQELIDDCSLAAKVKQAGFRTWTGQSLRVQSVRGYSGLGEIWNMVSRTAYTQLHYSPLLLFLTTFALITAFCGPVIGLVSIEPLHRLVGVITWLAMAFCYMPTLRYYRLSPFWFLLLPLIGTLYLAMTWSSAYRYYRGVRSQWKGRQYQRQQ